MSSQKESADRASHGVGQKEPGKLARSGQDHPVHEFAQIFHIRVESVDVNHIIFREFPSGITVTALFQKEYGVAGLPQIPGIFMVFAPEAAVSVQNDDDSFGLRVLRMIIIEADPVPGQEISVLYMCLTPCEVLGLHDGDVILFSKKMNSSFRHGYSSYSFIAFAG